MTPRKRPQMKKKKSSQPRQRLPVFGPANRPKPKKRKTKVAGAGSAVVARYAQMIANPFTSKLHPGMFGETATGMSQFKKSYNFGVGTNGTSFNNAGYILWWPAGNSEGYSSSNASTRDQPVGVMMMKGQATTGEFNTAVNKLFANNYETWNGAVAVTSSTGTTSVETPDNLFLQAIGARSKLLSAGMVMRCTASPLTLQGEYIKIDGLPISQLLEPTTAVAYLTVDRLFDLSAHEPRPFKAGDVVRHVYLNDKHNVGLSSDCADEVTDPANPSDKNVGAGNSKTSLAMIAKGTDRATLPTAFNEAHAPRVFGIAFRGINPEMMPQIYVDCYVNKEYTVSPINGIPNVTTERSGPDVSETSHLLASMKISAFNAIENGVGELAKGLVGKGMKTFGAEVLGLV